MSYFKVREKVKNNQLSPVYLLYGPEVYFIDELKKAIINQWFINESDHEDLLSTYDLEETPIEEVVTDAETYPFFGDRKLIVATNPVFLQARQPKLPFEHQLEALQRYLDQPVDYSILILIAPYEKIDNRKRITKTLNKQALVAACHPIKEYEVTRWIKSLANEFNVTIDREAMVIFERELSGNLQLLQSEIKKMRTYVGKNGIVTKDVAELLISQTPENSALHLADAVIERDLHKAISIYKDLEKMNEEPIALIGLLAFQFRMILRVKLLKQKGYSQPQIQKQVGGHPYVIKIAYQRERHFTVKRLEEIIDKLTISDVTMKRGTMEKELSFELLLYDLIQGT